MMKNGGENMESGEITEQLVLNLDTNNMVVQDNSLVLGNYDMSAMEQKMVLILISTIKKSDTSLKHTSFRVQDLAELLEISPECLYRDLKKICKSIMTKLVEIKNDDDSWEIFNIISYAKYKAKEGTVVLEINKQAYPYLLQLKKYFTSFKLSNALFLNSKYAIRLYQITKSSLYKKEVSFELEEFKKMLKIDKKKSYERFNNITLKVINPSVKEINEKTDINIDYKVIKSGVSAVGIKFFIKPKEINEIAVTTIKSQKTKQTKSSQKQNLRFTDYEQRKYDFDKLEKILLK